MKKHSDELGEFRSAESRIPNIIFDEPDEISESDKTSNVPSSDSIRFDAPQPDSAEPCEEPDTESDEDAASSDDAANTEETAEESLQMTEAEMSETQTNTKEGEDFIIARRRRSRHRHSGHSHHSHSHSSHADSGLPDDNVDDYVFAHYRKQHGSHHHHHHSKTKTPDSDYIRNQENEDTLVVRSTIHGQKKKGKDQGTTDEKKKRSWWKRILIILAWITGILVLLGIIAVVVFLILNNIGVKKLTDSSGMDITPPTIEDIEVQVSDSGESIIYNGKKYKYNSDIATILCIGVDKQNINDTTLSQYSLGNVGQSDAIYLVALNTENGNTTVFSVPRDTMTDVAVYDSNGKYVKTDVLQICQAYAYGDGRESSCDNTKTAVARLFSGIPIQTYFAMDLSAVAPINDAVGGVTLTMIDNSFYDIYLNQHFKGETLTLYGDNARKYVQQRDVNVLESTTARMNRQIHYLKAFSSKALSLTKKDITTPISLYNVISSNSISNLDAARITALAKCLIDNGVDNLNFKKVPGTLQSGENYAEYIVDQAALWDMIVDVYYTPVS